MSLKVTSRFPLRECGDCGSEHIGPPCGMTQAERFRTVKLASDWMPSKQSDRALGKERGGKDYYDPEVIKDIFGQSGKENKEELMESTQGVGYATAEDIQKHPELVAAHFLDNPANDIESDD